MRQVLGLDGVGDERNETVFVALVKPRPLSIRVQLQEPQLAVLADEVEPPEPVAGFVHKALDCAFFLLRKLASRPGSRFFH